MSTTQPRADRAPEQSWQTRRYWGSVEPPKAKAEFFSAVTTPGIDDADASVATIRMYGPIDSWGGWWGISTEDVARVLDALPASVEQIVLRINSPGGEVWEAMAILNMLGAHRANVTAVVDGIAASAASFIAASCPETVMSPGSQMMIHSPSSIVWGNARSMRKTADFLDTLERSMIEVYTDKAGEKNWAALLAEETWLTASDAVELGLADRVAIVPDAGTAATVGTAEDPAVETTTLAVDDAAEDRINAAAASARASALKPPSSSEPGIPNRKENVVANDESQAGVNERLGTTDAEVTAEAATAAPAAVTQVNNFSSPSALPEGVVAIDATVLADLQRNAQMGAEARIEQDRTRRDGIVSTALQEGRITAASRDHFRALLDSDEAGTTATLASLAKNTVPVEEIGHQAVASDADAYPAHWKR
ncbi:MAG: Clp protease ClpP [Microbacterium sp.]|jgi:ATP-dependent protease ClpP protease subunit|nr:Clp protease ClpP [Microbacterium sp.]